MIEANGELPIPTIYKSSPRDHLLTLAALGIIAHVSCDLLHELAGHGGVCIATGGQPITFSTVHFQCDGGWQPLICAAGILFNVAAGIFLWLILRRMQGASAHTRYFLWLSMAFNLFTGAGYIITSSASNSGDLANAFRGLPSEFHWRTAMLLIGIVFYYWSVRVTTTRMRSFIGADEAVRVWRFIFIPYFAAALVACAAAVLNSVLSGHQALLSAISSTLGAWGFLFLPLFFRLGSGRSTRIASPVYVTRSLGWIITAVVIAAVFIAAIGPGVRFGSGISV
jgi:hypothetical protein